MHPNRCITLFLCGDVMTGRGIDQILPTPCDPVLYEPFVHDARDYVTLAESVHGTVPRGVPPSYIWGDALEELARWAPDVRIINLETAVTTSSEPWPEKGINYRMHPANVGCLSAAAIDCCGLANNHVLDWGVAGLEETLDTLHGAAIRTAGAGRNADEAQLPAVLSLPDGARVLVFAMGSPSSGIPREWAATDQRPGVHLVDEVAPETVPLLCDLVARVKQPGDIVVASIHWGGNWGYAVPAAQRRLAHRLIDEAGVHVVHGHSSHHAKGIEVYHGHPILYGCGDFLNDYEGIEGYAEFRSDLSLMYFVQFDTAAGRLADLWLVPLRTHRLQLVRAGPDEVSWIEATLSRESLPFGARVQRRANRVLQVIGPGFPEG